jgi:ATP-binding cassette subfamily C protein
MRVIVSFARAYPWQSLLVLVALVVAGTVEGASMTALIPAIGAWLEIEGGSDASGGALGRAVLGFFGRIGLPRPTIGQLLLVAVSGMAARSLLVLVAKRRVGYTVAHVATDLRLALLRALLKARWEYFLRQPVGKLANSMATEVDRSSKAYLHGANLVASCVQLLAYTVVALLVQWQATLTYVVVAGAIIVPLHHFVRVSGRAGRRITKLNRGMLASMTDSLQSVKPLKAMARQDLAATVLSDQARAMNKALRREVTSKEAMKATQEMTQIGVLLGVAWAGKQLFAMSPAEILVMLILLARMLNGVGKVQASWQDIAVCESAYWSLRSTIRDAEEHVEELSGRLPPHFEREIRFEAVQFQYDDRPVLGGLSLTIESGSFTTLVGLSGSGKTTIVDLITGLVRPQAGRIWIDDTPLDELDLVAWRHHIGYVPQENTLLHDSVQANVTLGDPQLTPADVERALRGAGAWDFVAKLPLGMQSSVGERGSALSGGQRQRILVARALVHRPRLLILDEATSALDPDTAAALAETLHGLRGEVTILAVTHQTDLVGAADRVYRLEKGQATEIEPAQEDAAPAEPGRPLPST